MARRARQRARAPPSGTTTTASPGVSWRSVGTGPAGRSRAPPPRPRRLWRGLVRYHELGLARAVLRADPCCVVWSRNRIFRVVARRSLVVLVLSAVTGCGASASHPSASSPRGEFVSAATAMCARAQTQRSALGPPASDVSARSRVDVCLPSPRRDCGGGCDLFAGRGCGVGPDPWARWADGSGCRRDHDPDLAGGAT